MADPWKAPEGEDTAAAVPRQVNRYAPQSTLADLARSGDTDSAELSETKEPKPAPTGHEALAALAAEAARAASVAPPSDVDSPVETGLHPPPTEYPRAPADTPVVRAAGAPAALRVAPPRLLGRPASSDPAAGPPRPAETSGPATHTPGLHPAGSAFANSGHPNKTPSAPRPGGPIGLAGAPSSGLSSLPAPVRLSPPGRTAPVAAPTAAETMAAVAADQATIPLRRRPIATGPASVSAAPPVPGQEPPAVTPHMTPRAPVPAEPVAAWSPSEDDILPARAIRRGRPFHRSR